MVKKKTTTSKSAAAKKTTKTANAATVSKKPTVRKAAAEKQEFTDEQIAMKAYEIYQARLARGDRGHGDDDWHKAVEELRKGKK
jgi:hypothetical protein